MIDIISDEAFERIKLILHDIPGGAEKALYGVISRATTTMRKVSLDGITSIYDIKRKDIMDSRNTAIEKKTKKVDGGVIGSISYAGMQIPIIRFGVTPKNPQRQRNRVPINIGGRWVMASPGVSVKVRQRKDRPKTRLDNAFVANLGRGVGVFERTTGRHNSSAQIMGVSTAQMAGDSGVMRKVDEAAQEVIVNRTEHEISRILNGWGR